MARWMMALGLVVAILIGLVALPALAATNAQEVEEDNSLASGLMTPHKDWGAGYAGGKVRALFFVYTGPYDGTWEDTGTRVREVVELGQRFDLDADAVLYCGSGDNWVFHGNKLGEDRAEALLQRPYDLYVIAGFPLEKLPAKMQYEILKVVSEGAGLLYCGAAGSDYLLARRQLNPAPRWLTAGLPMLDGKPASSLVTAYQLRKGRGAWLNYGAHALTPGVEFSFRGLVDYDYWMLLVGRAALWAAGKDSAVSVDFGGSELRVRRGAEPVGTVTVSSTDPVARTREVELMVRRPEDGRGRKLAGATVSVAEGKPAQIVVKTPRLTAGDYRVDVLVRGDKGVEAFGAASLVVESDYGVGEVKTEARFVEQGEVMSGAVTLRGTPPAGATLRIALRDSYGRVLQQTQSAVGADGAEYPFSYVADASSTILMRVEATLMVGEEAVEVKRAQFTVPKRRQGQMNFVMWDAPSDILGYWACRQMQEAGMGAYLMGSMWGKRPQPPAVLACDGSMVPYSTRLLDPKDENGIMQPMCWNDEPAVDEYVRGIVENQADLREQGVFVYSLGDEGVTLGCCASPQCLAAYREYLAAQYGTVAALNASWGSSYGSFDEVTLLDPKDNMEQAAIRTSFPRWYDRQAFARWNLMQFSGRFVKAYRKLDPLSLTGFEGTGGFGDDYDAILGINDWYGPYPSIGDDIVRSAAPRSMPRSNWMGYSKTGDALSDAAWRMVMKGMDGIWYWMWSGIGNWRGYLRPTLDYWPMIEDLKAEMEPVRQGLGDLILHAEPAHSGIALLYSLPSALSGQLDNSGQFVEAQQDHVNWARLTYDLGLDFRYVTQKMLLDGALSNDEFAVLVLPLAQALAADEVAQIRRFVEGGGTVIADLRPGVFDGHCKPLEKGALDDLFGIERSGRGEAVEAEVRVALDGPAGATQSLGKVKVDADVLPGAATAGALVRAGEARVPVVLRHPAGQGHAVLLNCALPASDPRGTSTAAARELLWRLYREAGVQAPAQVRSSKGEATPLTESRFWRTGDGLVLGMWRQMENEWFSPRAGTTAGAAEPVRVTFREPMHLYDLRAHKYLGMRKTLTTSLQWGRASFFLALPYAIGDLQVTLRDAAPVPGSKVKADIALDLPAGRQETFAAWVEVIDPAGEEQLWGRQVVMLEKGRGTVELARAFDDRPGIWRLRVRELFSNQFAEATWTVR